MIRHEQAGKPFRPSNGTMGESFQAAFCDRCNLREEEDDEFGIQTCHISVDVLAFAITDEEYPAEWCYGNDGNPTCTAFAPQVNEPPKWLTEEYGDE